MIWYYIENICGIVFRVFRAIYYKQGETLGGDGWIYRDIEPPWKYSGGIYPP